MNGVTIRDVWARHPRKETHTISSPVLMMSPRRPGTVLDLGVPAINRAGGGWRGTEGMEGGKRWASSWTDRHCGPLLGEL